MFFVVVCVCVCVCVFVLFFSCFLHFFFVSVSVADKSNNLSGLFAISDFFEELLGGFSYDEVRFF